VMAFVYIFIRRCFCISVRASVVSVRLKIPYHSIAAINLSKITVITQNTPISLDGYGWNLCFSFHMNSHSPYRSHVCDATINHDRSWKATGLPCHSQSLAMKILCDQLNNTSSLSDLSLCLLAEPSCAYDQGNFGDSAFSEDL
jgi:hypothetical protein